MAHFEKSTGSRPIFNGRVFSAQEDTVVLENGNETTREVITHPGGVGVVAIDEEGCVLLVTQFRYAMHRELTEIPAGKLEYGEEHFACGMRELEEETGCKAGVYKYLGALMPTPAYCTEVIHLYYATDLVKTAQRLDTDEFLSISRIPLSEAVEKIMSGEIQDAKTQIGILKVWALKAQNKL